jgi:hypothetical protein
MVFQCFQADRAAGAGIIRYVTAALSGLFQLKAELHPGQEISSRIGTAAFFIIFVKQVFDFQKHGCGYFFK